MSIVSSTRTCFLMSAALNTSNICWWACFPSSNARRGQNWQWRSSRSGSSGDFAESVVLAVRLYGERSDFVSELEKLHLKYVVAIRSNHGVWLPPGQRVRYTNWRPFARVFSNGKQQTRYIREIVFGQRGRIRYYHLTTDPHTLPPTSTWHIIST